MRVYTRLEQKLRKKRGRKEIFDAYLLRTATAADGGENPKKFQSKKL